MTTVKFDTIFLMDIVCKELAEAEELSNELGRLASAGYLTSQTGLDVAEEMRTHLVKAHNILCEVDVPEAEPQKLYAAVTLANHDRLIKMIKLSINIFLQFQVFLGRCSLKVE